MENNYFITKSVLAYLFLIILFYFFVFGCFYSSRDNFFLISTTDPDADDGDYTRLFWSSLIVTGIFVLLLCLYLWYTNKFHF